MTYVIYGARGTGSNIIEAACEEIGVPYEVRDLDARNDEHRAEAYAKLNPQKKMPALEAHGEVLTESLAILLTLDERHREAELLPPPGSKARAVALRWMTFAAAELYPIVEIVDYPERFAVSPDTVEAVRERARAIWRTRLQVLEDGIAGAPYLLEGGFSAADLYLAPFCKWGLSYPNRAVFPRFEALMAAVWARPAAGKAWRRHWGAPEL